VKDCDVAVTIAIGDTLFRPPANALTKICHRPRQSILLRNDNNDQHDNMGAETESRDLLQDLHQLSEAARERILKVLPRDAMIEILKAALLEWDVAQKEKSPKSKIS